MKNTISDGYLFVYVEKFIILCYTVNVSTCSQIRLRMVRGNAGGIVLHEHGCICLRHTLPRYTRHTYTPLHPYSVVNEHVDVYLYEL